ncbi:MAG: MFS transporter [Kordiimonadaceae bacterium]|nr:MFS transporter [Kordiimonadaceae bacterium]MBO6567971.1 MFS transporter [Kordiimonadaceae bacterium]MBO6964299.1 MFS transporter [Kordiimonadaceae bacterium]
MSGENQSAVADKETYPKPLIAWYMVFLLLVIYTISFIDRQILGLLARPIIEEFEISFTQFGLLTGFAFAIFYATFGLVCARIADSKSRRGLIAFGLFFWSLMTAATATAKSFSTLFLYRMGVGVGEATLAPAANSLLADSFPKHRLSTALSVYSMGIPVGTALAFMVGGSVIALADNMPDIQVTSDLMITGWKKVFLMVGIPGMIMTILMWSFKEPTRKGTTGTGDALPLSEVGRYVVSKGKAYATVCIGVSLNAALGFGSATFVALFFQNYHSMSAADIGLTFGSITIITGPLGLLLGGMLADRWYKKGRKDAHILALMTAPLGYGIPSLVFPFVGDTTTAWAVLGFANIFINLPSGVAYASMQIITPNQMRGQVVAMYVLCTTVIGYGMGPFLLGLFTDQLFGGDIMKLHLSLALLAAITTPLAIATFLWGRKAFASELEKEEARLREEG